MYQQLDRPEPLFGHLFLGDTGYLVTASAGEGGWQQDYWRYPEESAEAAESIIDQAQLARDTYYSVHLYRQWGNRRAANAFPTVRALWADLDDGGRYPDEGPQPTAIITSSAGRFHLYWRLTHPVAVEWAVDLNRRIATWAQGDTGKAGLSTVLRPPGSANYKRPKPELVGGYLTGVAQWHPDVIEQAIPELELPKSAPREPYDGPNVDLAPFLEAVEVIAEVPDSRGCKFQVVCPWIAEHSGGDRSGTYIGRMASGGLWFACRHAHCEGRTWREFRSKVRELVPVRNKKIKRPGYTGTAMEVGIYRG